MNLPWRRVALALAPALVIGVLSAVALGPLAGQVIAQTPVPESGFVSASGTRLMVGGRPWRFLGYNMPCSQPFILGASQPYVLAGIAANSGATALRMWFFQRNGGPANWKPFDDAIATAKSNGMRIIPTLVNQWPACEPTTGEKTQAWYRSGYRRAGDGYPLSFRDFAVQMAAHYANEPAIAFWQLVNEAEAPTGPINKLTCDEAAAAATLRSFADDMAAGLHAVDRNHLVSLGTLGGSQCGIAGSDYSLVHSGNLDLCEFHDYGDPLSPLETDQPDGLSARLQQCKRLNRPMFVGEAGIVHNVQAVPPQPAAGGTTPAVTIDSLNLRAGLFRAKINAAFGAGVAGYDIWFKGPAFDSTGDSFSIGDGDPVEAMLKEIRLTAPAPHGPGASLTVLLPLSALALVGVASGLVWWWRRKGDPATTG